MIDVKVVLQHDASRVALLEEKLMNVSDPRSPEYGNHLSISEIKDILSLSPHATYKVETELKKYNVSGVDTNKVRPSEERSDELTALYLVTKPRMLVLSYKTRLLCNHRNNSHPSSPLSRFASLIAVRGHHFPLSLRP